MKAARVTSWGSSPEYISVPDLPAPSPTQLQLKVVAAGLSRVVPVRAAGHHPTAIGADLPFDPSVDGVGVDEATGEQYYINSLAAPVFADRANVERSQLVRLPPDVNPVAVAGWTNAAVSSWMALKCRAIGGCHGRVVAILGATSLSGRIAAAVARSLGATRVIGLARNEKKLAEVAGLDIRVCLQDPLALPPGLDPVHIVLDYVGGPASLQLIRNLEVPKGENLQFIMIGNLSGSTTMNLPLHLMNSKPIILMASGAGSSSPADFQREMPGLMGALGHVKIDLLVESVPMEQIKSLWGSQDVYTKRFVLVP